jgi:hypothetical protein
VCNTAAGRADIACWLCYLVLPPPPELLSAAVLTALLPILSAQLVLLASADHRSSHCAALTATWYAPALRCNCNVDREHDGEH